MLFGIIAGKKSKIQIGGFREKIIRIRIKDFINLTHRDDLAKVGENGENRLPPDFIMYSLTLPTHVYLMRNNIKNLFL